MKIRKSCAGYGQGVLSTVIIGVVIILIIPILFNGCFSSKAGPAGVDTIQSYKTHILDNPEDENIPKYQTRIAELEFAQLVGILAPIIKENAIIYESPSGSSMADFSPYATFVFDSFDVGWYALHLSQMKVTEKTKEFSPQHINTSSFILKTEHHNTSSEACLMSQSIEDNKCQNGYHFKFYDRTGYKLSVKQNGEEKELCRDTISPTSTRIPRYTRKQKKSKYHETDYYVHNGHITIYVNGVRACRVEDSTFDEGYTQIIEDVRKYEFSAKTHSSNKYFVKTSDVIDIQFNEKLLRGFKQRSGEGYDEYNKLLTDMQSFSNLLATQQGSPIFTNTFFEPLVSLKLKTKIEYEKAKSKNTFDSYLAFHTSYPDSPYENEVEEHLFAFAIKENSKDLLTTWIDTYPKSMRRIDAEKRISDIVWRGIVKNNRNKKQIKEYLKAHPNGFYSSYAKLLLEKVLPYIASNKKKLKERDRVMKEGQKIVAKNSKLIDYNVELIAYQDGTIVHTPKDFAWPNGSTFDTINTAKALLYVHEKTCEVMKSKFEAVEECIYVWDNNKFSNLYTHDAIMYAIGALYKKRIDRNIEFDIDMYLMLLDKLETLIPTHSRYYPSYSGEVHIARYLSKQYASLNLPGLAIYWLYRELIEKGTPKANRRNEKKKYDHVKYLVKSLKKNQAYFKLIQEHPLYQNLADVYGLEEIN